MPQIYANSTVVAWSTDGSQDTLERQKEAESIHQDITGGHPASLTSGNNGAESSQLAASGSLQSSAAADETTISSSSQHPSPNRYVAVIWHIPLHLALKSCFVVYTCQLG